MAFILLGATVILFWPEKDHAAVWITYDGVSASDTNRVTFTITNAHAKDLRYHYGVQVPKTAGARPENWVALNTANVQTNLVISVGTHAPAHLLIPKHSAVTCSETVPSTRHWKIALTRKTAGKSHAELSRVRQQLWKWAWNSGGWNLSRWVWSGETFVTHYGPEMLGDKPVVAPPAAP